LPEGISNAIAEGGDKRAISNQATELGKLGFDMSVAGLESKDGGYSVASGGSISSTKDSLSKFQTVAEKDSEYESSDAWKQLQSHKS
jgi:hypothetical protein